MKATKRFKLYKHKKLWIKATATGVALFSFGLISTQVSAKADDQVPPSTSTQTMTPAQQVAMVDATTAKSTTLKRQPLKKVPVAQSVQATSAQPVVKPVKTTKDVLPSFSGINGTAKWDFDGASQTLTIHAGELESGTSFYELGQQGVDLIRDLRHIIIEPKAELGQYSIFTFGSSLNLQDIRGLENLDLAKTESFRYTFAGTAVKALDVTHFDVSRFTEFIGTFGDNRLLQTLDLSHWDTRGTYDDYIDFLDFFENDTSLWQIKLNHNFITRDYQGGNTPKLPEAPSARVPIPGGGGHLTAAPLWQAVGTGTVYAPRGPRYTAAELMDLYIAEGGPDETYVWAQDAPDLPEVPNNPDHHHTISTIEVAYRVHYKGAGKLTPATHTQIIKWEADRDDVTGTTLYTPIITQTEAVETPTVKGYIADLKVVPAHTLQTMNEAPVGIETTVTYHKQSSGEMAPEKPTPPNEKPGQTPKPGQSTEISSPGMSGAQHQTGKVAQVGLIKQTKLPQTNEHQSMVEAIADAVLTLLGLFGMISLRKKH